MTYFLGKNSYSETWSKAMQHSKNLLQEANLPWEKIVPLYAHQQCTKGHLHTINTPASIISVFISWIREIITNIYVTFLICKLLFQESDIHHLASPLSLPYNLHFTDQETERRGFQQLSQGHTAREQQPGEPESRDCVTICCILLPISRV